MPRAESYARRCLQLEPWDEQAHRQVMQALALQGQRSAALAQYEACRKALAEELGVEPEPETTRLYQGIRAGLERPPPRGRRGTGDCPRFLGGRALRGA